MGHCGQPSSLITSAFGMIYSDRSARIKLAMFDCPQILPRCEYETCGYPAKVRIKTGERPTPGGIPSWFVDDFAALWHCCRTDESEKGGLAALCGDGAARGKPDRHVLHARTTVVAT